VNIAARLQEIADPGTVCLSEDAYHQVRNKISVPIVDKGNIELKNIPRPVRVYALQGNDEAHRTEDVPAEAHSAPPLSVVVLPFVNLGQADKDEQFVDGITETLTTVLARIAHSAVIARNTAFTFKGKAVDARQVGKQLQVRYILEGSVQRSGDRIRVNVQLIDAESGNHLWADRFDKTAGAPAPPTRRALVPRSKPPPRSVSNSATPLGVGAPMNSLWCSAATSRGKTLSPPVSMLKS
jgi:TolB-like protein